MCAGMCSGNPAGCTGKETAAELRAWGELLPPRHQPKPPIQPLHLQVLPDLRFSPRGWRWQSQDGAGDCSVVSGCFPEVLSTGKQQTTRRGRAAAERGDASVLPAPSQHPAPELLPRTPSPPSSGPGCLFLKEEVAPSASLGSGLCRRTHCSSPARGRMDLTPLGIAGMGVTGA